MQKLLFIVTLLTLVWGGVAVANTSNNTSESGLALQGYDPVSYHQQKPVKGDSSYTLTHKGVVYRFSTEQNLEEFKSNPQRFVPAYGGWCAWAMLDGQKVDVDPERYKIINGKTYLYYNTFFVDTLKKWNKAAGEESEASLIQKADDKWKTLTSAVTG